MGPLQILQITYASYVNYICILKLALYTIFNIPVFQLTAFLWGQGWGFALVMSCGYSKCFWQEHFISMDLECSVHIGIISRGGASRCVLEMTLSRGLVWGEDEVQNVSCWHKHSHIKGPNESAPRWWQGLWMLTVYAERLTTASSYCSLRLSHYRDTPSPYTCCRY